MSTTAKQPDLDAINPEMEGADAADIIRWAHKTFGEGLVLSTSFGMQSAVMLHLATSVVPDIPVIFIDTGFHFLDTYKFADALKDRLKLNLKVYQAHASPAWTLARHGKLWEQGVDGLNSARPRRLPGYDVGRPNTARTSPPLSCKASGTRSTRSSCGRPRTYTTT